MKVAPVEAPGGLDKIAIEERVTPTPGPGEVPVRIRAGSLNFHGFAVVAGIIPVPDGRIPMLDGAGEVTAVGPGVKSWKVGDPVLSTFFPTRLVDDRGRHPALRRLRLPDLTKALRQNLPGFLI